MAIAQNLDSLSTANIQSPWLAGQLIEESKIVSIDAETSNASGSSRKKKASLTTNAPRLAPANPITNSTAPVEPGKTFLTLLALYMASVILTQIDLTQNQATVSQSQFSSQTSMISLAQNEYNKAVQAYQAYEAELQAEQHESFWERVCGYVAAAFCCVLAAFTGGATAFLAAGLLTAFMMSGGEQDLESYLNNTLGLPSWASSLMIAVVGTAVTCGVSGACSAALDSGADEAAAGAADAAASAAQSLEDSVSEDLDAVEDTISDNNLDETAQNSQKNILSKLKNALAKAAQKGFNKGNLISTGGQFFATTNPLSSILQAMGVSQTVAAAVGLGLTMVAFGGAEYSLAKAGSLASGADSLMDALKNKLGSSWFYRVQGGLDLFRLSTQGAEAYYGIESGLIQFDMANTTKDIGQSNANIALYNGLISILESSSNSKSFSNLMNAYAQIENGFDALIEPGRVAVEVL